MKLSLIPIGEIPKKEVLKCPNPECDQKITLWLVNGELKKVVGASQKEEGYKRYFECMTCGTRFVVKKDEGV